MSILLINVTWKVRNTLLVCRMRIFSYTVTHLNRVKYLDLFYINVMNFINIVIMRNEFLNLSFDIKNF